MVVLDDLQWADDSTLELLRFLVRRPRPVPLVLVGAYRPDERRTRRSRPSWPSWPRAELVQLPGCSPTR